MDGRQFDDLLRSLSENRRSLFEAALGATLGLLGLAEVDAKGKKKKKKCAKKCADGCCTGKHGKCIQSAQQNASQCGTGGEICRTNCGGSVPPPPASCGAECSGCCDGTTCIALGNHDQSHCGAGGVACFACDSNQICLSAKCCGKRGHSCGGDGECCLGTLCNDGACCASNGSECTTSSDCCNPDISTCENGQCVFNLGAPCLPGQLCHTPLVCNPEGICAECPEGQDFCDGVCCPGGQQCYGTVCCATGFGCAEPNNGQGACCQFENCCEPQVVGCLCEFDGCCA